MLPQINHLFTITREPELRHLPSGSAICNIGLACNGKKKVNDQWVDEPMFIDAVAFGKTGELINQHLAKGKQVFIKGALKLEQWQDQNGGKRSKHSITIEAFDFVRDGSNNNQGGQQQNGQQNFYQAQGNAVGNNAPEIDIDDDEIPF